MSPVSVSSSISIVVMPVFFSLQIAHCGQAAPELWQQRGMDIDAAAGQGSCRTCGGKLILPYATNDNEVGSQAACNISRNAMTFRVDGWRT